MLGDEEKKSTVTWIGIHHYKRGVVMEMFGFMETKKSSYMQPLNDSLH